MKYFDWNKDKNRWLIENRGIGFEAIVDILLAKKDVLDVIPHPNKMRYPNQRMYIIKTGEYACLVPFIETDGSVFFKNNHSKQKSH